MTTTPRRAADRAALRQRDHIEPRPERRAKVLSPEQLGRMLQQASARDAALVAVMAAGAARVGEALLLCWGDIDSAGLVTLPGSITKTGRSRCFTLPAEARLHLERWREQCPASSTGWLFPGTPARNPLSVRTGQRIITQLAAAAGIAGVSSHSLRRSALTEAHRAGLPLQALAEISGHQSPRELARYLDADAFRAMADRARGLLFAAAPHPSEAGTMTPAVCRVSSHA